LKQRHLKSLYRVGQAIEAEQAQVLSFDKVADANVAGGYFVETATNNTGSASFVFNITTPGDYILKARRLSPNTADDSFFVGLSDEPAANKDCYILDTGVYTSCTWTTVSRRGNGTFDNNEFQPLVFNILVGEQTFTFCGRDSNTRLDQLRYRFGPVYPNGTCETGETFSSCPGVTADSARLAIPYRRM
jgi:hypothetical protein